MTDAADRLTSTEIATEIVLRWLVDHVSTGQMPQQEHPIFSDELIPAIADAIDAARKRQHRATARWIGMMEDLGDDCTERHTYMEPPP